MCGALLEKQWEGTSCAFNSDLRDFGGGEMQKFELNGHIASHVSWWLSYLIGLALLGGGGSLTLAVHSLLLSTLSTTHVC